MAESASFIDEMHTKIREHSASIQQELKDSSFDERFDWVMAKKEEGSLKCREKNYKEAIDTWMQALCGYDFGKYKDKRKAETESKLKIPIVNNMALSFMMLAQQHDNQQYRVKAKELLD